MSDKGRIVQGCNNKISKKISNSMFFFENKEHFAHIYSSIILKNLLLLWQKLDFFKVKFYKTPIPTNPFFNYLWLQDKKVKEKI